MASGADNDPLREVRYEVLPGDEETRLDLFLNDRMEWRSRSSIQRLIADGMVALANRQAAVKASTRVKAGDVYSVRIPRPKRELDGLASGAIDVVLDILYEDQWILAVDKPAGIPVHPAGRLLDRTVVTALKARCLESGAGRPEDIKLCHRLDLETSGVLLVSKDPVSMPRFAGQFEQRTVEKEYLAIVHGEMKEDSGEIDLPIGLDRKSRINMKRGIDRRSGQQARTSYRVEERFGGFTLVRLELHTGRHHQLRVHLSAIGHPIVGDKVYGLDERFFLMHFEGKLSADAMERLLLPRQALHAHRLKAHHVMLKKDITMEAPLPDDMQDFMRDKRAE